MVYPNIKQALLKQLNKMPVELQRRVLDFAQALTLSTPRGVSGREQLRFAGTLRSDDAKSMSKAIEDACEQVDPHEW
jgi:hypothetical protein